MKSSWSVAPTDLRSGRELGKYRLVRRLGKGGGGEVWLAENTFAFPGEAEEVALKIPRRQEADHVRLLAEPKMLKKLAHPNIVDVHSADKSQGLFFVVMEYMAGGSLRDLLRAKERLSPRKTRQIAEEVLDGLAHAHRARVVHRDLKPENILFSEDGIPKIGDFGIAREFEGNHHVTGTGGSRGYKAPEQLKRVATPASDVWALGVTLCEALSGQHPFVPTRKESLEEAILGRPIPMLRGGGTHGQVLVEAVARSLQREATARFADAGAMLEWLRSV